MAFSVWPHIIFATIYGQYILNPLNHQCSKTLSLSSPSQHANQTGNNICVSFQFDDIFSFVFLRLVQYMQSQISSLCGSNSSLHIFQVTCPKGKPVLVTVYVERPKRKASSNHPHQHHPYIHHTIKREVIHYGHGAGGQGYISRRAELLQYSQCLRLSARSAAPASKPFYPKPNHTKNPQPPAKVPYPLP